jgi:hypothetical protein
MKFEDHPPGESGTLSGTLKLILVTAILALLLLGILLLLDVIPVSVVGDAGGRTLGVLALVAAGCVLVTWSLRTRG